jgi:hypothetical protein
VKRVREGGSSTHAREERKLGERKGPEARQELRGLASQAEERENRMSIFIPVHIARYILRKSVPDMQKRSTFIAEIRSLTNDSRRCGHGRIGAVLKFRP